MIKRNNPDEFFNYLEDTSNIRGKASLLYIPQNNSEVINCLKDCYEKKSLLLYLQAILVQLEVVFRKEEQLFL